MPWSSIDKRNKCSYNDVVRSAFVNLCTDAGVCGIIHSKLLCSVAVSPSRFRQCYRVDKTVIGDQNSSREIFVQFDEKTEYAVTTNFCLIAELFTITFGGELLLWSSNYIQNTNLPATSRRP